MMSCGGLPVPSGHAPQARALAAGARPEWPRPALYVYSWAVLKAALPRPSTDAVTRGGARSLLPGRLFDDEAASEADDMAVRRLTRAEVDALRAREPVLSPWKVIGAQVLLGGLAALIAGAVWGSGAAAASALYGAAVVAVPGALVARGATSRLTSLSPMVSVVAMMGWGMLKMMVSVLMLALAARIVPQLIWPVMLVTLAVCLQTYWFALLWRGRGTPTNPRQTLA